MIDYEREYQDAQTRTHAWGLACASQVPVTTRYLSASSSARLSTCVTKTIGHLPVESIGAQCFAVHAVMRAPLEKALGLALTYTIGYINLGDRLAFHTPIERLKQILDRGLPIHGEMNLHAWLTLPSHEIIDLTLATTYGIANNIPKLLGSAAFIHPSDMVGGQSYHPQLVGEDFLQRIGAMRDLRTIVM